MFSGLLISLALTPTATRVTLAHQEPPPQPDKAAVELPAVNVEAPRKPPKQREVRRPVVRTAALPPRDKQQQSEAAAPDATGSTTPGVGSGPVSDARMASQVTISGETINARPLGRPGEVLDAVPGLIVTQHSGEGKANQYFLRGYNLDHGTDLAIFVDDVPVNMRTHAHGQGYADLNWLIPETIGAMEVRKGPYFADQGDFSSVGSVQIGLIDRLSKGVAEVTAGSFGYRRALGMNSTAVGSGSLLIAGELGSYNGPWVNPDEVRKVNGLLRFSQGTATDGFSITGMAYSNKWNSTDQVPQRAIASGEIDRFGAVDPTDGGRTSRFALSGRVAASDDAGSWKANGYLVKSELDLFNNFTFFLNNPALGDQFQQHDNRTMAGANISRTLNGSLAGLPMQTTFGVQSRYDAIDLALTNTFQRSFLSNVRSDRVGEGSVGIYAQSHIHWTSWLRTTLGWRGDYYTANVDSLFNSNNSGHVNAAIGSPKFTMVVGPFDKTEFFLGAGLGMHSNDARGATTTEDPAEPSTKLVPSPLLVRTKGAEIGVRTKIIPNLDSSLSLFLLDQASEIVFQGDSGDTAAKRPTRRYGIEWTNRFRPKSWIEIDAELAVTRARFIGFDGEQAAVYASLAGFPEAQIGNAPGNYIPNAPAMIASAGITLGEKTGWFGTLRWRYLGSSPLTEDNAFRSLPTSIVNARLGYREENGWRMQLDVRNLLNAKTNQISYAYGSLIKSDSLYNLCFPVRVAPEAVCQNGVMDYVVHPVEPPAVRVTVARAF